MGRMPKKKGKRHRIAKVENNNKSDIRRKRSCGMTNIAGGNAKWFSPCRKCDGFPSLIICVSFLQLL